MLSERRQKIWINVTTSAAWNRPAVGIVRVEAELKRHLKKLYPQGSFGECLWNGNSFVEYDQKPSLSTSDHVDKIKDENKFFSSTVTSKRDALLSIAHGIVYLSPKWSKYYLFHLMRNLYFPLFKIFSFFRNIKKRIWSFEKKSLEACKENKVELVTESKSIFHEGDIFISFGADWNYEYYKNFFYLRKEQKIKIITCCYDLIPILYPQYCLENIAKIFPSYFLDVADGSDLILCISQQSENDLKVFLDKTGGCKVPTGVIKLGDTVTKADKLDISETIQNIVSKPFILYVSTIERRKNHEVLYRAYHMLCQNGDYEKLPKLVFVGMPGWGVNDLLNDIDLDPCIQGLIIQLNSVSDAELLTLYENAVFCVYPSFYEGWGLPVGEALSLGKIVVCSNGGSLPEVGKDLVLYADPWRPDQWAETIMNLISNENYRIKLTKRIKDEYKTKSWSETATSVYNAINSINSQ
ncbi:glycosyltransferase family 4 protein [Endozoicomonas montiporae]|uniref:Glycosyltransferase WbpX n=1 Tax=Endozoicomonas montiporae CL-33 TaxID=570277 RepID=A0A142BDK5_9GAMM|nr:glycosyltransferase family 1 protein [Endozoicomonas montiporae]AMO56831.1 glycosyltransferase WbpX [Endozoicomonas montiporae CL-33]